MDRSTVTTPRNGALGMGVTKISGPAWARTAGVAAKRFSRTQQETTVRENCERTCTPEDDVRILQFLWSDNENDSGMNLLGGRFQTVRSKAIAPSFRHLNGRREGAKWSTWISRLLLVVNRRAGDLLASRIGSSQVQRTALAVGRHHNATAGSYFAVLFIGNLQVMVINLRVRPRV